MLTNLGQDNVIKEGFKFGAVGYLIKAAYTPDQVVKEVTSILNQQKSVQPVAAAPAPTPATPVSSTPTQPPTSGQ